MRREKSSCSCPSGSTAFADGLLGSVALVAGLLLVSATPVAAQLSETGDVCGANYNFGSCAAGDVNITFLDAVPVDGDDCENALDTVVVNFLIDMENVSAAERLDPAYYVALDGGSGETGTSCLHGALNSSEGIDDDSDSCFDLGPQGSTSVTTIPVALNCTDDDLDGFLDAVNICTSAKTSGGDTVCTNVTEAFANPGSKCECNDIELATPIPVPADLCADVVCEPGDECFDNVCNPATGICEPVPIDDPGCEAVPALPKVGFGLLGLLLLGGALVALKLR